MDLVFTLDFLVPGAKYIGMLVGPIVQSEFGGDQKAAYDAIVWLDERPQPTWNEIVHVWPAVQAGMQREQAKADLAASDTGMIRAVEDLVDALVAKGVITPADLPQKVQEKLAERKALRAIFE